MKLTIDEIKNWVSISEESPSGLIWIKSPGGCRNIGDPVGGISVRKDSKYYIFGLMYCVYYVHRVVFCLHHGFPIDSKIKIDHVDGNQLNNSIDNLRIATSSENSANTKKCKPKKSSIYKGVSFHTKRGKWVAAIKKDNKTIRLGSFNLELDAAISYNNKAVELFGEYANINKIGD